MKLFLLLLVSQVAFAEPAAPLLETTRTFWVKDRKIYLELNCTPPVERADGTPLMEKEIKSYSWFVSLDRWPGEMEVADTTDCRLLVRIGPGGTSGSFTVKTNAKGGRQSIPSNEVRVIFK